MSEDRMLMAMTALNRVLWTALAVTALSCGSPRKASAQAPGASFSVTANKTRGAVGLTFTLTNRGKSPLWINKRMSSEEDSSREPVSEIRLKLVGKRGRVIPFACSSRKLAAQDSDYAVLPPGKSATSEFNDLEECYFFDGDEAVTVSAYYLDVNPRPPSAPAGASPLKTRVDAEPIQVRVSGHQHSAKPSTP
jgi:hypothetical protein